MKKLRSSVYVVSAVSLIVLFVPFNLLAHDEGNEPCCYNAPHNPAVDTDRQSEILFFHDEGNEPCCYGVLYNRSIDIDQGRVLLSAGEQTDYVGLLPVAPAVHPTAVSATAFLREEEHEMRMMGKCDLAIRQS